MPIDSKHPEYEDKYALQNKCRIVCEGEDAVKAAGPVFLPMLGGEKDQQARYEAYRGRATFFNASGRTVAGLTGVVFRKPPKFEFPDDDFRKQVTNEGDDYIVFLRKLIHETIRVGRVGILSDMKDNQTSAHVAVYQAESIINWRTEKVDGIQKTVLVVLEEETHDYSGDDFEPKVKTLYRVLVLTDADREDFEKVGEIKDFKLIPSFNNKDDNGRNKRAFYAVAVYEKEENLKTSRGEPVFTLVEGPFFPEIRGTRVDTIPFVAINPTSLSIDRMENPPILDVVNINLSHYKVTADLKHGQHFTALPTAWVAGFKSDQQLMIGSETAWIAEDPNAKAAFLEFTGAGLAALRDDLKDMQEQMAVLGSRLLEEPKRQVEAAETHVQRKAGEASVIGNIASNVESGVKKALRWCAQWMALDPDKVEVQLNKDFIAQIMQPAMLIALMQALQQSRISQDTFFYNLEQGEILPDGRTVDEELQLIEQRPPLPSTLQPMELEETEEPDEEEGTEEEAA